MSTATKPSGHVGNLEPHKPDADKQLRHDRIFAIAMLILMFLIMAFVIWLATITNGGVEIDPYEYWTIPF